MEEVVASLVQKAIRTIEWRAIAACISYCPICAHRQPMIRLAQNEMGVRCVSCRSSAVTMSIASVLRELVPDLDKKVVYELSARGPLNRFLSQNAKSLSSSEFFEDVPIGSYKGGVQCQDVQRLTFESNCFDVCTSTEVFEHVPDDRKAFREMSRVLRRAGLLLFTVPLSGAAVTLERAVLGEQGQVVHLLSPEYHVDPVRRDAPILAFRNYGEDIVQRLLAQGFERAGITYPKDPIAWGYARPVVYAFKAS